MRLKSLSQIRCISYLDSFELMTIQNIDREHKPKKASIYEAFHQLRRGGSNSRPPQADMSPFLSCSVIKDQSHFLSLADFNSFSLAIASPFVSNSSVCTITQGLMFIANPIFAS